MAEDRPIFAPASMSSALASLMAAAFCFERIGHREQAGVLLRRGQFGQFARRRLGLLRQLGHLLGQGHRLESTAELTVDKAGNGGARVRAAEWL